jgi:putative peptide zinc metalloprotease protein
LENLRARLSQLEGLLQQQQNLSLTAPIAGVVTDRVEALHVGQWINKQLPLAYLIDPAGEELHALAPETDVGHLHAGQSARFIPEGPDRPSLEAQVAEIRDIDESSFTVPYLLSVYGGDVPVREDANRKLKPETSVYRITLHLVEPPPRWNQAVRGTVLVKGPRISFAQRAWEQTARIFIRESGA